MDYTSVGSDVLGTDGKRTDIGCSKNLDEYVNAADEKKEPSLRVLQVRKRSR